jgi:hypothetical protein
MSRHPAAPVHVVYVQDRTNGLGIAGFVCSLVGLLSCGLFGPIGLLLSAIGMSRPPRGFAIAGLILGLAGSLWLLVAMFVFGGVLTMAAAALAAIGLQIGPRQEMLALSRAIERHERLTGTLPADLSVLPGLAGDDLTDPWNRPYRYVVGPGMRQYELRSLGPDGVAGTADDIVMRFSPVVVDAPPSRP